jgi:hypothetical protein
MGDTPGLHQGIHRVLRAHSGDHKLNLFSGVNSGPSLCTKMGQGCASMGQTEPKRIRVPPTGIIRSALRAPYDCGLCGAGFSGSMIQAAAVEGDLADSGEPEVLQNVVWLGYCCQVSSKRLLTVPSVA